MSKYELAFEDLFEIYTPGSIDRKIYVLDSAWQSLGRAVAHNANDEFITSEISSWEAWAKDILDSSWLYKTLPTGIMDEFDQWQDRYNKAYNYAAQKYTLTGAIEPPKKFYEQPKFWTFASVTVIAIAGLYFYINKAVK